MGKRVFGGLDVLPKAARDTHARQLLVAMAHGLGSGHSARL